MTDSFKDIYEKDKNKTSEPAIKAEDVVVEKTEVEPIKVGSSNIQDVQPEVKRDMTVLEEQVVRVDLTESIKDVLTEQRELTAQVLESVMKTNTKIANNVAKHVKASADTNAQLVEAINALTEKMSLLETKLEAIENLEIPTPIVQVNSPSKRVEKIVHRDNKGFVTHITESEVSDETEGE